MTKIDKKNVFKDIDIELMNRLYWWWFTDIWIESRVNEDLTKRGQSHFH